MKKYKLTSLVFLLCLSGIAQQTLGLFQVSDGLPASSGYTFAIAAGDPTFAYSFGVKNTSGTTKTTKVTKTILQTNMAYSVYFCYGLNCYPPTVSVSPNPVTINANDQIPSGNIGGLVTDFDNGSVSGTCIVKYTVSDVNNASDTVSVVITYIVGVTGISSASAHVLAAQVIPNPVSDFYCVKTRNNTEGTEATIKIYDCLGNLVQHKKVIAFKNEYKMNAADLPPGIYILEIEAEEKRTTSIKFIVAR